MNVVLSYANMMTQIFYVFFQFSKWC